jgi:hypothetical protein
MSKKTNPPGPPQDAPPPDDQGQAPENETGAHENADVAQDPGVGTPATEESQAPETTPDSPTDPPADQEAGPSNPMANPPGPPQDAPPPADGDSDEDDDEPWVIFQVTHDSIGGVWFRGDELTLGDLHECEAFPELDINRLVGIGALTPVRGAFLASVPEIEE